MEIDTPLVMGIVIVFIVDYWALPATFPRHYCYYCVMQ